MNKNLLEIKANRTKIKDQLEVDVEINENITDIEFTQVMESVLIVFDEFEKNILDQKKRS